MRRVKKKLNKRFVAVFVGVLLGLFTMLIGAVQVTIYFIAKDYVYGDIFARQSDTDDSLTSVFDEAAYLYARLLRTENGNRWSELSDGGTDEEEKLAIFQELCGESSVSREYFVDVALSAKGKLYFYHGAADAPAKSFVGKAESAANRFVIGGVSGGAVQLGKRVQSVNVNAEGVLIFYINEEVLGDIGGLSAGPFEYSFLMTADYYVVAHGDPLKAGRTIADTATYAVDKAPYYKTVRADGKRSIITVGKAEKLSARYDQNLYIVSVSDYNAVYKDMGRLTGILFGIGAGTLVLGIVFAVWLAKKLSSPINRLNRSITEVIRTGKKNEDPIVYEGDEIYQLEKNYDEMINRIFGLIEKNKEDMETQRKLELDTLQMQINPHFLYNTLDAIAWMAKIKKQSDIEKLVVNLARFFRISLHKGDKFITVGEEIELIMHFIEIELIRFPDKFTIEYNMPEEIAKFETLKLILQPMVENAIKHGISSLERMGHIVINVYGEGDSIVYEVIDDGIGFEPAEDIITKKRDPSKTGGYGLKNVDERIKLEYGAQYGVSISSKIGGGTKVTVRIQKRI